MTPNKKVASRRTQRKLRGVGEPMRRFKYEVAEELGLRDDIEQRGWGDMTTREVGKIGGNMVRKMVRHARDDLARGENLDVSADRSPVGRRRPENTER